MENTAGTEFHCREHVPREKFSDYCDICNRQKDLGITKPKCGKYTEESTK